MPSQTIKFQETIEANSMSDELINKSYNNAEKEFSQLLVMEDLDNNIEAQPSIVINFENKLSSALSNAY